MATVKSSEIAYYVEIEKDSGEYFRIGVGVESMSINMNPEETDYADITMDVEQTDLESYKPTFEGTGRFKFDDPVYKMLDDFANQQVVLDDAKRNVIRVSRYNMTGGKEKAYLYKDTTIVINEQTLNGAKAAEIGFKFSTNYPPVEGTAEVSIADNFRTAKFTPDTESEASITAQG